MQPTLTEYLVHARQDDLRRAADARQLARARQRRAKLRDRVLRQLREAFSLATSRAGRPAAPPPKGSRASVPIHPSLPSTTSTITDASSDSRHRPAA
jgi:hypothetical protein